MRCSVDDHNVVGGEYGRLMEGPPEQRPGTPMEVFHRTWSIRDEESIAKIRGLLAEKSLFIADGHHRYETALAFRNEERASGRAQARGPHEYVMMYITSMSHPGLTILPAHRLVKGLTDLDLGQIETILGPYFLDRGIVFLDCETVMRFQIRLCSGFALIPMWVENSAW